MARPRSGSLRKVIYGTVFATLAGRRLEGR